MIGSIRLSPLDENHMTSPPSPTPNKLEREKYSEPRIDSLLGFFATNSGSDWILFCGSGIW